MARMAHVISQLCGTVCQDGVGSALRGTLRLVCVCSVCTTVLFTPLCRCFPLRPTPCSFIAAAHGHLEIARLLLENGADVNRTEQSGTPALMMACRGGHEELATLLMEVGWLLGCGALMEVGR